MSVMQSPCRYCEKQGCGNHSNCDKYTQFLKDSTELKERIKREKQIYAYAGEENRKRIARNHRKRRGFNFH